MAFLNKILFILVACLYLFSCSDGNDSNSETSQKDHVWKEQTDTINKAKEVEAMMLESAATTKKAIETQGE
ncbi:MAG: hypothetical protein DHS20C09_03840 [marine bacterium B5-7]|nr:MAG: hypothetical protein DHS20C09_03840 [marine bacterium B5-7]